jgi:hypothetical protein
MEVNDIEVLRPLTDLVEKKNMGRHAIHYAFGQPQASLPDWAQLRASLRVATGKQCHIMTQFD